MNALTIEDIRLALARPLPGLAAQVRLAPPYRIEQLYQAPPADARPAGVLIALYPYRDALYFPLTRRTDHLDSHKGQISLPGGRQEPGESLLDTALRETWEEIGASIDPAWVLGTLSPLYVPPSGFLITPFVAALPERPRFAPVEYEVAELIETPITALLDPAIVRSEVWTLRDLEIEAPFFQIGPHKVWGATAMVLSEFAAVIGGSS
ncbi:MAG TPA: CoA pyrophosphatase [Anaerolineae bacterium]|nr:CoA pyrophosphatase [Anaerolineae bacterium]